MLSLRLSDPLCFHFGLCNSTPKFVLQQPYSPIPGCPASLASAYCCDYQPRDPVLQVPITMLEKSTFSVLFSLSLSPGSPSVACALPALASQFFLLSAHSALALPALSALSTWFSRSSALPIRGSWPSALCSPIGLPQSPLLLKWQANLSLCLLRSLPSHGHLPLLSLTFLQPPLPLE